MNGDVKIGSRYAFNNKVTKMQSMWKTLSNVSYLLVKRVFDIVCSLVGVVCILPLAGVIKLCTLLSGDKNSIFYTQKRIGQNGKIIYLYKFRSMVSNANEILEELLKDENYRRQWEENQKFEDDPRITKIGAFLRKTSLDEVPQFINVLKGDMSLIGPRPLIEGELDMHNGNHEIYEAMKPGITGWWGCNGRSSTTYEERLELEYYYVQNASLLLDLKCIFKTIKAVLMKEGAK